VIGAAKKRAPNKLAALSADFVHKEHAEEVKTDKQRAHERKKAAAEEARKNYKNTLLHPEEEFVAAKVPTVDATASHSFITSLLSRAAGGTLSIYLDFDLHWCIYLYYVLCALYCVVCAL